MAPMYSINNGWSGTEWSGTLLILAIIIIIIIIKAICNAQDPLKKAANALSGS